MQEKKTLWLKRENEQNVLVLGEGQCQEDNHPFITLQRFLHCQGTLRASSRLHDELFRRILRSPMKFFDTTPTGRILNRFSKDMDEGISALCAVDPTFGPPHYLLNTFQSLAVGVIAPCIHC